MTEYKYICAKCRAQATTILFKKYQCYLQGKRVLCTDCQSKAYFDMLIKLKEKWEENNEQQHR